MSVLAAVLVLQAASPPVVQDGADLPAIVHLADGTSVPLRGWSLSYEYLSWPAGSSQALATTARRDARELWTARKRVDTRGLVLELEHRMRANDPGEGAVGPAEIPAVSRLRLAWRDGRKEDLRPDPPHRELLLPDAPKSVIVLARSLDVRGVTLAGTRRELCVVSYTSMVQCGVERSGRVVKLEFPGKESP